MRRTVVVLSGMSAVLVACSGGQHRPAAPAGSGATSGGASSTGSPASSSSRPLPVSAARLLSCRPVAGRRSAVAQVRLRNARGVAATYTVQVRFSDGRTHEVGTATGTFDGLAAHAARTVPIISVRAPKAVAHWRCGVAEVRFTR